MDLENFLYTHDLKVRFADVDMMGHVNNATYHTYLEEARLGYVDSVCHQGESEIHGMILAKTVIDYLLPLYVGNVIQIYVRCSRLGRKSFDLQYVIVNEQNELASTATTTLVGYDYVFNQTVLISEIWRQRIADFELVIPYGA